MDIYARIYKVDEATRTVTGRAAQEVLDRSNEIMDYKKSKPLFMAWSAECFADSGGKSHGNVREMHTNVAAGKLTALTFDDTECAIDVEAQIVDDNSWEKVTSGVFTGFSIGGAYKSKSAEVLNGKMVTRYVAQPNEISLVDRPCIPTAKFFFTKRDGSTVRKTFQQNRLRKTNIEFRGGKVALKKGAELDVFKKIHASPRPFDPDFLQKFDSDTAIGGNASVREIRKAHETPLRADVSFDALGLSKAFDSRRLRKVTFPPQSSNAASGGAIADTGASNRWKDQPWSPPKPNVIGGQGTVKAVLDALKQDLANPKRMIA